MEFLDEQWFDVVGDALSRVDAGPHASARLAFSTGEGATWHLVLESGRVAGWGRGAIDRPDCTLRWTVHDAARIWSRTLRGDDALRATAVDTAVVDGRYVGPPAPLGLQCRPELAAMPAVPDATFTVHYRYRRGPFGDVDHTLRFEDGRLTGESLGVPDHADVNVDVTYRAMALVRAGELSILEALEEGRVDGAIGPMATLAGITESPEFHAAEHATGRHAIALAVLGDVDADERVAASMAEIASRTDTP